MGASERVRPARTKAGRRPVSPCPTVEAFPGRVNDGQVVAGTPSYHQVERTPLQDLGSNSTAKRYATATTAAVALTNADTLTAALPLIKM